MKAMPGLMRSERVRVPTSYCRYVKTVDMSLDLHTSRYPESRQFIPCLPLLAVKRYDHAAWCGGE